MVSSIHILVSLIFMLNWFDVNLFAAKMMKVHREKVWKELETVIPDGLDAAQGST